MNHHTIVVFFNFEWNWPADYAKQTALSLSNTHDVVCYLGVEPISIKDIVFSHKKIFYKAFEHVWVYKPIQIPFQRFMPFQQVSMYCNLMILRLINRVYFHSKTKPVAWVFDHMYSDYLNYMKNYWLILYDCVDLAWDNDEKVRKHIQQQEKKMILQSTWMTVNSNALLNIHKHIRKDIRLVPLGFDELSYKGNPSDKVIEKRKKPTIELIGVIDWRLDFSLLYSLASRNPKWDFILWGRIDVEHMSKYAALRFNKLTQLHNVIIGRSEKRTELLSVLKQFDICMIPYDCTNAFNKYSFPMKVYEYFYLEKPVISTPIVELKRFPELISIGKNCNDWESIITSMLLIPWSSSKKRVQKNMAIQNNWQRKITQIVAKIL